MNTHSPSRDPLCLALASVLFAASAPQLCAQLPDAFYNPLESWSAPFPAHRVIGDLFFVGTDGLAVFLLTSDEGHILINTGLGDSTPLIRENIESVGFRIEDIAILLTMQAHWDHAAAMAEIREIADAEIWATPGDTRILGEGGVIGGQRSYSPIEVDRVIRDGEFIELGEIRLRVHEHPGHTEGSSSYSMQVRENDRDYEVAIVNMGTINPGVTLVVDPFYPGIADDFARTFRSQKAMKVDVWVSAHGGQYGLPDKYQPGQPYSPDTFVDPDGFLAAVEALERTYLEQLAGERR